MQSDHNGVSFSVSPDANLMATDSPRSDGADSIVAPASNTFKLHSDPTSSNESAINAEMEPVNNSPELAVDKSPRNLALGPACDHAFIWLRPCSAEERMFILVAKEDGIAEAISFCTQTNLEHKRPLAMIRALMS